MVIEKPRSRSLSKCPAPTAQRGSGRFSGKCAQTSTGGGHSEERPSGWCRAGNAVCSPKRAERQQYVHHFPLAVMIVRASEPTFLVNAFPWQYLQDSGAVF